jgi:hypothetical protein
MLVAGCATMPCTLDELLAYVRHLDAHFVDVIQSGLAVFDEHHPVVEAPTPRLDWPVVFRVTDTVSRQVSLQPHGAGIVVFNLPGRRIVQVHNTYADVERKDRGRLRRDGRPVQQLYTYELPEAWQLLP